MPNFNQENFAEGGFKSTFVSKISVNRESCFSQDIMPTNSFVQPFVGMISFLSVKDVIS